MSEKDIDRWRQTVLPARDFTKKWTMGNGGSWDRTEPLPISDELLAELAQYNHYQGCPWNCLSMPLSNSDREYMYLLYYSMHGMVARIRQNEKRIAELEHALRTPFEGS